jgi:hypothetical protein
MKNTQISVEEQGGKGHIVRGLCVGKRIILK